MPKDVKIIPGPGSYSPKMEHSLGKNISFTRQKKMT